MAISFDQSLAADLRSLAISTRRGELIASNLANVDTPRYKARDIDFRAAMEQAHAGASLALARTQTDHLAGAGAGDGPGVVRYRIPSEPSLDGNTVDTHMAQAHFAENALRYQAALTFIGGRIRTLREAIKGQ